MDQVEIKEDDLVYILCLAGGLGARIIQTSFVRSLIRLRKEEKHEEAKILVVDNSLIGAMVTQSMQQQNIVGINYPELPNSYPHHPGIMTLSDGTQEHPMFVDFWRDNYKFNAPGSFHNLLNSNWNRSFSIDYSFSLTKLIHQHKFKADKKSFIAYHYAKGMGLEYDGGTPPLRVAVYYDQITQLINSVWKPIILIHLGTDLNSGDYLSPINYRFMKVWSLKRWQELVDSLSDRYQFVQVYANQFNPELRNVLAVKVDNLNAVLQILESDKCKMFIATDHYLHHLAAAIKKPGIVLWGSVSPNIWGWNQLYHKVPHFHIWNEHSCDTIACWRPGMFDVDGNGKAWICPKNYNCMKSISVNQVQGVVEKVEEHIAKSRDESRIAL